MTESRAQATLTVLRKDGHMPVTLKHLDAQGRLTFNLELQAPTALVHSARTAAQAVQNQALVASAYGPDASRGLKIALDPGVLPPSVVAQVSDTSPIIGAVVNAEKEKKTVDVNKIAAALTVNKAESMQIQHNLAAFVRAACRPQCMLAGCLVAAQYDAQITEALLATRSGLEVDPLCHRLRPAFDPLNFEVMTQYEAIFSYDVVAPRAVYIAIDGLNYHEVATIILSVCGSTAVGPKNPGPFDPTAPDPFDMEGVGAASSADGDLKSVSDLEAVPEVYSDPTELPLLGSPVMNDKEHAQFVSPVSKPEDDSEDSPKEPVPTPCWIPVGESKKLDTAAEGHIIRLARTAIGLPMSNMRIVLVAARVGANYGTNVQDADRRAIVNKIISAVRNLQLSHGEMTQTLIKYCRLVGCPDDMAYAQDILMGAFRPHSTGLVNHAYRRLAGEFTIPTLLTTRAIRSTEFAMPEATAYIMTNTFLDCFSQYAVYQLGAMLEAACVGRYQYAMGGLASNKAEVNNYLTSTPTQVASRAIAAALPKVAYLAGTVCKGRFNMGQSIRTETPEPAKRPPPPYARWEIIAAYDPDSKMLKTSSYQITAKMNSFELTGRDWRFDPVFTAWYLGLSDAERRGLTAIPYVMRAGIAEPLRLGKITSETGWLGISNNRTVTTLEAKSLRAYCVVWGPRGEGAVPVSMLPAYSPNGSKITYRLRANSYRNNTTFAALGKEALMRLRAMRASFSAADSLVPYMYDRLLIGMSSVSSADFPDGEQETLTPDDLDEDAKLFSGGGLAADSAASDIAPSGFGVAPAGSQPPGGSLNGQPAEGGGLPVVTGGDAATPPTDAVPHLTAKGASLLAEGLLAEGAVPAAGAP